MISSALFRSIEELEELVQKPLDPEALYCRRVFLHHVTAILVVLGVHELRGIELSERVLGTTVEPEVLAWCVAELNKDGRWTASLDCNSQGRFRALVDGRKPCSPGDVGVESAVYFQANYFRQEFKRLTGFDPEHSCLVEQSVVIQWPRYFDLTVLYNCAGVVALGGSHKSAISPAEQEAGMFQVVLERIA